MKKSVKFQDLEIGDKFTCYGDIHLNYNHPKICRCNKVDENTGREVDGINFLMSDNSRVDLGWD